MGIKREGFGFKLPDPNSDNFFEEFTKQQKRIQRAHKIAIPLMIVSGILGLVLGATVIWAIITVVMKFKGG